MLARLKAVSVPGLPDRYRGWLEEEIRQDQTAGQKALAARGWLLPGSPPSLAQPLVMVGGMLARPERVLHLYTCPPAEQSFYFIRRPAAVRMRIQPDEEVELSWLEASAARHELEPLRAQLAALSAGSGNEFKLSDARWNGVVQVLLPGTSGWLSQAIAFLVQDGAWRLRSSGPGQVVGEPLAGSALAAELGALAASVFT